LFELTVKLLFLSW